MFRPGSSRTRVAAGFTLIELMIVIGLIALLAAILVPNFQRARSQANLRACGENLRHLAAVVAMYQADNHGLLPGEKPDIWNRTFNIDGPSTPYLGRYLPKTPACPLKRDAAPFSYGYIHNKYSEGGSRHYYVYCFPTTGPRHSDMGCPAYFPRYCVGVPEYPNGLVLRP